MGDVPESVVIIRREFVVVPDTVLEGGEGGDWRGGGDFVLLREITLPIR